MSREEWKSATLVLAAHGAAQGTPAQDIVEALATQIRARELFAQVVAGFRYGEPRLKDIPGIIGPGPTYVVPFTAGVGPFARDVVPRALAEGGEDTARFNFCRPLGTHEGMADIVADLAQEAVGELAGGAELLLVGHGTTRDPVAAETLLNIVATLSNTADFAKVRGSFLEQEPRLADWREFTAARNLVVVPFIMGGGGHEAEIREMLDLAVGQYHAEVEGRRVRLTAPVGHHPALADLIVDLVEDCG